jgi:class 3 adenylate cyclase
VTGNAIPCSYCGRENREDSRFCDRCGAPLTIRCGSCARELSPHARFCDGCGARVAGEREHDVALERRAYTPRHLAEKILTQRSALEGERKQVTVLFVDIQRSMELAEGIDPEDLHRLLDRFFQILADGVHRFEGTINQYTGDGVMALFGAPIAHEDHAQRACYAALHLGREVRRYAQQLRREQGLDFHVRMGLNSGEVVVGRIGDDLRMDYTAQGHTVGLAARLEKLAEPGRAYLTEHTAALASGFFELEDLGEFKLAGHSQATRVFGLQDVGPLRTRLDVARSRGFSRFVGRDREMAVLEQALAEAAEGRGQIVNVVADPGQGKSRLCFEFAERSRARGTGVTVGHGVSHGKTIPFLPILEYLREAFEIGEQDDEQRARKKLAGTLLLIDREIAEDLPLIFDFFGVPDPENPAPLVEGEGRERRVFAILRRLLEERAREAPQLILLEDLHWFDSASQTFLANLIEAVPDTRTLLLVNHRPEFVADWTGRPQAQQIALAPLAGDAIEALLADLLGTAAPLADLAATIRERARGNPFFIEEVVQSLVESGTLVGTRGAYRLTRPIAQLAIPRTVQALIAARIDRLGERDKLLLDNAAVIGKRFDERVLQSVSRLSDEDFADGVRALAAAEFIFEQAFYPERSYAFVHPLTQEVAYQSQLSDHRRAVHASVARALEELEDGSGDEPAALIAHHWEASGNSLAAARWIHRAARRIGPSNPGEAMALWRKLLQLLPDAPERPEHAFLAARACRWLLFLGASMGMPPDEADTLFTRGKLHSEHTSDRRSLALIVANFGYYQAQIQVNPTLSVSCAREALRIADEAGNPLLQLTIGVRLAQALQFRGRFREAATLGQETLRRLEAPGAPEIDPLDQVTLFTTVGDSLNELGRPTDGIRLIEAGLALAGERGLALNAGFCHNAYVRAAALAGEPKKVEFHALAAMRAAERTGHLAMLVYAHDVLNLSHQLGGRWAAAVESGERAIAVSEEHGVAKISESGLRAHLTHAYLGADDIDAAREMGELALEASARCGPRYAPRVRIARARVLLRSAHADGGAALEAELDAAQAAVDESEARIYEPIILETAASLARVRGQDEQRKTLLAQALQRYREMGLDLQAERLAQTTAS